VLDGAEVLEGDVADALSAASAGLPRQHLPADAAARETTVEGAA
jgi:hypothetical protein